MIEIRLYVEGHPRLHVGFQAFLTEIREAARARGIKWNLTMGHGQVARDFMKALRKHPDAWNVLLLDSEGPDDGRLLDSLRERKDWTPPSGMRVRDGQVCWMVQLMESWFLADRTALRQFYGDGFSEAPLPGNPQVEQAPKNDVLNGLKSATRNSRPGEYRKSAHAPKILALLSVQRVRDAAPNCRRLFASMIERISS